MARADKARVSVVVESYWGSLCTFHGDNEYVRRYAEVRGDRGMLPKRAKPGDYTDDHVSDAYNRWMRKSSFEWRNELVQRYAWAIPCDEALECIARYGPIVEIGAGTGYWAHLLRQSGVDVVAYDKGDTHYEGTEGMPCGPRWTEVLHGEADTAARHPDAALMLCWPPLDEPMAADAVRAYAGAGGRHIIYIGESEGGCTGDDAFFAMLNEEWEEIEDVALPTWFGIRDSMTVHKRKRKG